VIVSDVALHVLTRSCHQ